MRMIFEKDTHEDMLEIVLSDSDLEKINEMRGATKEFSGMMLDERKLSILIRKENRGEKDAIN